MYERLERMFRGNLIDPVGLVEVVQGLIVGTLFLKHLGELTTDAHLKSGGGALVQRSRKGRFRIALVGGTVEIRRSEAVIVAESGIGQAERQEPRCHLFLVKLFS